MCETDVHSGAGAGAGPATAAVKSIESKATKKTGVNCIV